MTTFEANTNAAALRIIARLGITATYARTTGRVQNVDGTVTAGTSTESSVTVSPPNPVSKDYIASMTALDGDTTVWLAGSGLGFTPKNGDTVTIGSEIWTVVAVRGYRGGTTTAAWDLILRGGASS